MTFFEAAVEVLRRSGRPLHYKKITEVAVRDSLLSHIGKAPEQVMNDRLAQEVSKQRDSVLVQTRPGVFSIREESLEQVNAEAQVRAEQDTKRREQQKKRAHAAPTPDEDDREPAQARAGSRSRRRATKDSGNGRQKARGGARDSKNSRSSKRDSGSKKDSGSRSKRRRRRRRSKRDEQQSSASERRTQNDEKQGSSGRGRSKARKRHKSSNKRRSSSSKSSRTQRRRDSKAASTTIAASDSQTRHLEEGPVRLNGIAEAAYTVLDEGGESMPIETLAKEIFGRKLVKFHTHDEHVTVQAAMANDNQVRTQRGHRPLFERYDGKTWGLTEWALAQDAVLKEQAILSLSEEIRQAAIQHLGEALIDVQTEALEQIALKLLERLGYRNIKVSKRSSEGDVFFTADWRQGLSDVRVCIQVVSDGTDDLTRDQVSTLRGTLPHYSAAEGVVIHLGRIEGNAVKESRKENTEPITLIDRATFVELLIRHGIGVRNYTTPITMVDSEFIDALKS